MICLHWLAELVVEIGRRRLPNSARSWIPNNKASLQLTDRLTEDGLASVEGKLNLLRAVYKQMLQYWSNPEKHYLRSTGNEIQMPQFSNASAVSV
jgi:hypothetical protein